MKRNFFILFALFFALLSCNNDDDNASQNPIDQLPPATQTGENTFGCLVNGEPMAIEGLLNMTAIYQGGFIQFGGGGIYMIVSDPNVNTEYSLIGEARFTEDDDGPAMCYYDFENTYEGFVKFSKIDQTNYIISGTFEFSTVTENCETVHITNGRFDMQYIP
ncbi:hypothetical protein [Mangrovimonas sp. DI 80]|uniref:hypothetical protein n=1 Tax=Mangrovimonas sp. DI 80 TaxID=1779330 RepID=UPI000976B56E|nr:hypothetical protein [Mangrovimonas sp. DI 80]OMP30416.1 hypothetical protein BKM32_13625 [Mangrovimonas sp. DI 80]